MRITQALYVPPVFRFWKDFGAGRDLKKRLGYFNQWKYIWNAYVKRMKIADKTLPREKLPPGARVMDAEDFMVGHIDAMPEQMMEIKKGHKVVCDHPWPYQIRKDPARTREPIHYYTIATRFFQPKDDVENLTHTIIETQSMEARPIIETQAQHIDKIQRMIDWAISRDSVLIRLPRKREYPKINIKPIRKFGINDERAELNVLKSLANYSQHTLSNHYFGDKLNFDRYLNLNSLSFPQCRVLLERDGRQLGLNLCIDHMTVAREPLPLFNETPSETKSRDVANVRPRTWKSMIEKTRWYPEDWSFKFPSGLHPRTIYLAARIKRDLPDDEMLGRNIMHAFGLTNQMARKLQHELPITLQVISYKLLPKKTFFFTRYQLNTLDFGELKNQAWHSGPIEDIEAAFRYYLDFENFESTIVNKTRLVTL